MGKGQIFLTGRKTINHAGSELENQHAHDAQGRWMNITTQVCIAQMTKTTILPGLLNLVDGVQSRRLLECSSI
jgi:hypothetical protein